MGGKRYLCHLLPITFSAVLAAGVAAGEFEITLAKARDAARHHRYLDVVELLTPYNSVDDPEVRYITAAEIGRAYFHLGHYHESYRAFRQAVRLRPDRVETALYLQATAYLVGDKPQALGILHEVLRGGARDLYLAVTLPGERHFLADPEVWRVLQEHSVPFEVDLDQGSVLGIHFGEERSTVAKSLAATTEDPISRGMTASAGPYLVWAFGFDSEQRLEEIHVHTENLLRYTPYRLCLGEGLDWSATPSAAMAVLGSPTETHSHSDHELSMIWDRPHFQLTLEFGPPRPPRPPVITDGTAVLRRLRMRKTQPGGTTENPDRIDE